MRIFIVGHMASGKSTLGKQLAQSLQIDFLDIDIEIEKNAGAEISWIFEVEGEEGFREREKKALKRAVKKDNVVISTGGGIVIDPENRKIMARTGTIIHLETSPNILLNRMESNKENEVRPLMKTGDPLRALSEIQSSRQLLKALM